MFSNYSPAERAQMLRDNADAVETRDYFKNAEGAELDQARVQITDLAIKRHAILERKKEAMAEFKEELKPIDEQYGETLDLVKYRGQKIKGDLFKFVDQEEGMVGYYNAQGDLVESRRALPEEKQMTITRAINQ